MFTTTTTINLPVVLENILDDLLKIGVIPVLVGGCIRDYFFKIPNKDYDIELFGLNCLDTIEKTLQKFGDVKLVGKSFGVLLLKTKDYEFDFALPRTEKKVGNSHTSFEIISNGNLSFEKAALRRDFTINAIGYDYKEKKFLDPFNGLEDIKTKTLKHINDKTFLEDSLRVYRAVQFVSRFDLNIDDKTKKLCKQIVDNDECKYLPKERVYEEFKKLFLKSPKPSIGFEVLKEFGLLKYFPELKNLVDCIQDKEYHPEGDVWVHTLMTIDELSMIIKEQDIKDEYRKLYLFYGILCHDFGKPFCTKEINGRITSHKHESLGIEPTVSFLSRLTDEKKFIDKVIPLVKNHLAPFQLYKAESSINAVKRLSLKCNIEDLCMVCLADCKGRTIPDKEKCDKAVIWVLEKARELNISQTALEPLVKGRDLIELGMKPSKEFKEILEFALNLQIDKNLEKEEILKRIKSKFL
ncbi:CCA tRNA nucleotidyltransferase [Arcobacter arenosus]|uniref:CCA tRNA nucleotidyltransferase n=1 Tax=Arcobacter arenosus TaxID=2576037 RepID=A0A5R8Y4Q5_9BACT|nr:CCA tRNA nucleotidyltransferase [Arcobacter arenosus]TLP41114.1 CCA tRNA nucleotidyltransferase [Arcobacter arenosus]